MPSAGFVNQAFAKAARLTIGQHQTRDIATGNVNDEVGLVVG